MHILFLSHYFPPEVNAPATRTYEHCKRWVELGHKVTVVTCAPNCPIGVIYKGYKNSFRNVEEIDGIEVIRIWTCLAPNKGFLKRIINYLSYMFNSVIQCMFLGNVDVLIATSPQFFCGWAGVLLHWLRKWPFILEIRDIWPESIITVGAMKKSKVISFLEILEKKMYLASDHIVAVGQGYKERIVSKGISEENISVVINGVDLEQFNPSNAPSTNNKFKIDNKFVCSYIGTVGMAHGLEVILKTAQICKEKGIGNIVFRIVGDGAKREELENLSKNGELENYVIFTGRLPKEEIPLVISSSDCCLVHLRGTELFGTVIPSKIFELMAMNIPIIMGVKGEAQEIVLRGKAGMVMEPDNPESLLSCIEKIKSAGKESFKGREYVSLYYDRKRLARDMVEIVERVYDGEYVLEETKI